MTLYNDNDPTCARWLSNLIAAGHLPPGVVDARSVADLTQDDLEGHDHADFFAGIGGWGLARRIAGWPESSPLWTASLPCQPFSSVGRFYANDERHLWPVFRDLVEIRLPRTIVGEQVASKHGRIWADWVRHDLERLGYAFGTSILPAASVGAPHRRERIWWVAHSGGIGFPADSDHGEDDHEATDRPVSLRPVGPLGVRPWRKHRVLACPDGRARRTPVESRFRPLADGVPGEMGRLRAYGNSIVPQVAAIFLRSVMEIVR